MIEEINSGNRLKMKIPKKNIVRKGFFCFFQVQAVLRYMDSKKFRDLEKI